MPNDPSANAPIELPEVLQEELESFGFPAAPIDQTKTPEQRMRETYARIRGAQPERSALCISGGGIRSATFALGVVQALARAKLLPCFDYLSTVSGGGYLGSMLTAWIHSHPRKLAGVAEDLAGNPREPEARPLRHLRQFSNYISPKLGLFSADGWTLVATALRNLLLNWTVFVLILAGLLTIPWLGLLAVLGQPTPGQLRALLAVAFICFALATAYPGVDLPSLGHFRWKQKYFLLGWMFPLVAGMFCLGSWWAGFSNTFGNATYPNATAWLASRAGKESVVCFLTAFSLAGLLLSVAVVITQQARAGILRERTSLIHWRNVLGMMVASILVIGAPGTVMLWWIAGHLFSDPSRHAVAYLTFGPVVLLQGFFLLNSLFVGVTSWFADDDDREWWARAAGWVGAITAGWLAVHALVFWVPQWIEIYLGPALKTSIAASGGILGFLAAKLGASAKTPAFIKDNPDVKKSLLLTGAALAFFALLSCGVSVVVDKVIFVRALLKEVPPEWHTPNLWVRTYFHREAFLPGPLTLLITAPEPRPPSLEPAPLDFTADVPPPAPLIEPGVLAPLHREIFRIAPPDVLDLFADPADPWLITLHNRRTFDRFGLMLQVPPAYTVFAKWITLTLAGMFLTGLAMGLVVNVNRFSLHATYRNRLVRAYLGAARADRRRPHPFTGFDPDDDIGFASLTHARPLHVVNMALNLVGGEELAWQERKADSFTATRLHCGNHRLGYRPSAEFCGGIRLGTALAISGAAASPNQGYNSSPVLTFLMTLFNVRLGWWLGNPGLRGSHAWKRRGPNQAALPLFTEALGLTNESRSFIDLSDGGHFENLAIYEMLRRRCRWIVVIDAEQDGGYHFEGLGGIVRKARIDMRITITFPTHQPEAIKKTRTQPGSYFAIGEIDYRSADPEAENGRLLYIKPSLIGGEPTDVQHYASTSKTFPHESTSDQFFSESQFEAYRALGEHAFGSICHGAALDQEPEAQRLQKLFERAAQQNPPETP